MENFEKQQNSNEEIIIPEGWKNKTALSNESRISPAFIAGIVNQYRESNLSYFKDIKDRSRGRVVEYYSPELIEIIKNKHNEYIEAPNGWMTKHALADKFNFDIGIVFRIANKYRKDNPNYFVQFRSKNGLVTEHYAPELVEIISQRLQEITEPIEGWQINADIAKKYESTSSATYAMADKYRETNPEYFKEFKLNKGINEYYAPELVEIVHREIKDRKENKPQQGWMTSHTLATLFEIDREAVVKMASKHKKSNPEYFKQFRASNGLREHYAPELVAKITKEIEDIPKAPEKWITNQTLANRNNFVTDARIISRIANEYRDTNPEYFKKFRIGGGIREHYSPEFVKIIYKRLENRKEEEAPKGWLPNKVAADSLQISPQRLSSIVSKYRETNPEYFKQFRGKNSLVHEHYSPELVALVQKEIGNKDVPEAPENWLSTEKISEGTGVSKEEVERITRKLRRKHPGKFGKFKNKDKE